MSLYGVAPVLLANWSANTLKIIIQGILFVVYYITRIIFGLGIDLAQNPSFGGLFQDVIREN